ncbi:MAG TPA: hypothetical protein VM120_19305 [Bryobacteraceae bacterium]|nr:hypothetical protein [Bryobacteraceae bacterium]
MREVFGDVRLRWGRQGNEWCAVLVLERDMDAAANALLATFVERVCKLGQRPEFAWADQIKKNSAGTFREAAQRAQDRQEWFAAFGSDLCLSNGTMQSTDFDMTGGQQKFLLKLREASIFLSSSRKDAERLLREALFGPWLYETSRKASEVENSHSMGLDPSTLLQGAFTADEPAGIKDKRGVRGAIWLAFEAMPFFPCVYDGRLRTAGFTEQRGEDGKWRRYFEWGVWTEPLTMSSLRILLLQSREQWTRERGILERFRSERVNLNKDYYSMAAADLVRK